MQTGENEQDLRRVIDLTRMGSLIILLLHFYYFCYPAFYHWGLHAVLTDIVLHKIVATGLFRSVYISKGVALALLGLSMLGARGRKAENLGPKKPILFILGGLLVYFFSALCLHGSPSRPEDYLPYMILCSLGYLTLLTAGGLLSRIIWTGWENRDIFNKENECFPQQESRIENEFSINLPGRYYFNGTYRSSWINIINPFRSFLVLGSPGSGKSYFVIRHVITQHIQKGFSMFIYDFKFDDLSRIAYNYYLKYRDRYAVAPGFFVINFDDLSKTHRCNPLDKENMLDITDASESARTILLGLNKEWIKKQGDFFVESPINFLTAIIWYLRRYKDGAFCTLPHVIELMLVDYDTLFALLKNEPQVEALINPFISAYVNEAMEQLEGQVASAKISMARLVSPPLYYVLSGNDFTLDINNPAEPKIVCMGNNPQKIQIYGAVLSLYISRLIKMVNKRDRLKSSLVFDEFPTLYVNNIDQLIATARSNKVATTLGVQDFSQLKKNYGRDQAEVIMNITGNIISGQVSGETAKQLSDRFGKILQDRVSLSIHSTDSSINRSRHLDSAIQPSTIASLSSGEFVGVVADDPQQPIDRKGFHCSVVNNHKALASEERQYRPIPVIRTLTPEMILENYQQIKRDIQDIIQEELERMRAASL